MSHHFYNMVVAFDEDYLEDEKLLDATIGFIRLLLVPNLTMVQRIVHIRDEIVPGIDGFWDIVSEKDFNSFCVKNFSP